MGRDVNKQVRSTPTRYSRGLSRSELELDTVETRSLL
jgi:hypothetical protein